jgi:hypothetical protein
MIHYALQCAGGHDFDGWFKDSASFDEQSRRGLLACPECADTKVERALMAPSVRTRRAAAPKLIAAQPAAPAAVPAPVPSTAVGAPMPDQVRAVLQRIRAEVEKSCDYVGPDFAQAARDIATGAEPPRAIYGEATPEQEAELAEDGIEVARIPWVPRANG